MGSPLVGPANTPNDKSGPGAANAASPPANIPPPGPAPEPPARPEHLPAGPPGFGPGRHGTPVRREKTAPWRASSRVAARVPNPSLQPKIAYRQTLNDDRVIPSIPCGAVARRTGM